MINKTVAELVQWLMNFDENCSVDIGFGPEYYSQGMGQPDPAITIYDSSGRAAVWRNKTNPTAMKEIG